jgi:hypothetical protein
VNVTADTSADYSFEIVTQSGTTVIPALKKAYAVYNVNLSAPPSSYSLTIGDLNFELQRDAVAINASVVADAGVTTVVDINASASNLVVAIVDEMTLTGGASVSVGSMSVDSEESLVVLIRRTNQTTGVAAMTEINVFSSASGAKTTIWVDEIY